MDKDEIIYMLDKLESFACWLGENNEVNVDKITYMLDKMRYQAYWLGRNRHNVERSLELKHQIETSKNEICDLLSM